MKTLILGLSAILAASLHAQVGIPELSVSTNGGASQKLELREISIDVQLEGALVETILELEFFNHTTRMQEGEFKLQLPEGATVSTYALDIRGYMRPGVSVEKDRAKLAYETIKRQMVDPGIVEREAGNVYRTRIFPIEAKKPKRVRIGYIQRLDAPFEFKFPLKLDRELKKFVAEVRGPAAAKAQLKFEGKVQPPKVEPGVWKWEEKDLKKLDGELVATSVGPKPDKPTVHVDRLPDGAAHFVVQGQLPQNWKPKARAKSKRVRLIWDASHTGRYRDRESEFEALRKVWEWLGEAEVVVAALRHRLEPPKTFQLKNGDGSEIERALREIVYDGVADFSKIGGGFKGATIIVTDGEGGSPGFSINPKLEGLTFVMSSGRSRKFDPRLLRVATARLNLRDKNWFDALTKLEDGVTVEGAMVFSWDVTRSGRNFTVTGRIPAHYEETVTVKFEGGKPIEIDVPAEATEKDEWSFARRIFAQRRLVTLEKIGDEAEIRAFAKAERLVSDFTSVIVLERFEDHVRYRIPPPEPELVVRYATAIQQNEDEARVAALINWKQKLAWHQTDFPWIDWQLAEQVDTVGIFVKASRAVFEGKELNEDSIERFENWLPAARDVVQRKNKLKSQKEFDDWRVDVGQQLQALNQIRLNRPGTPDDQPVYVSVRGYVNHRGVFSDTQPFTLRDAIKQAGGPFRRSEAALSRVYLYRDAARTGYNMTSSEYRDVVLKWGDMIVVEEDPDYDRYHGGFLGGPVDPFADLDSGGGGGLMPRRSPGAGAPAVFEEPGSHTNFEPAPGEVDPFGAPTANPAKFERKMNVQLVTREPQQLLGALDEALLESFAEADDPKALYLELAAGDIWAEGYPVTTLIEIARFFFDRNEADFGERVLSNLVEILPNKIEATRAYAYWLAEFGSLEQAVAILDQLAEGVHDEETRALVYFDAGQLAADAGRYRKSVESEIRTKIESNELATIALTDYFGRGGKSDGSLKSFPRNPMKSDVRIVLTSMGDQVELVVAQPSSMPASLVGERDHGGRTISSQRVHEYQMRYGLPGEYRLVCRRPGFGQEGFGDIMFDELNETGDLEPIMIHVTYYLRWGTNQVEQKSQTLVLTEGSMELDAIEFGWPE